MDYETTTRPGQIERTEIGEIILFQVEDEDNRFTMKLEFEYTYKQEIDQEEVKTCY